VLGRRMPRTRNTVQGEPTNESSGSSANTLLEGPEFPRDHAQSLISGQRLEPRDHLSLSMYEELVDKFERLNSRFSALEGQYANIVRLLEPRASEPHIHSPAAASASQVEAGVHAVTTDHSSQRAPVNPRPLDQGITLRDPIPPYRAEVPASQPLRRNQELETWLRHVEQAHPYGTDEALIRAARGSCRGTADIVINSPVFDGIGTWDEFKETLRQRLRGTCSSMEYLRHLGSYVLGDTSPRDFYLAVETMVYQGMRDYPGELGPAEPLMRRTFLQGLPPWLREKLLLIEDQPLYRVVEAAQKVWHHRHYAGRVEKPLVSFSSEAGPKPRSSTPREGRSPAASPPVDPLAELPVRTREPRRWCPYHQVTTHDASECRAVREGNQCTRCGRRGHVAERCFFRAEQRRAPPDRTQPQPQRATARDNDDGGRRGERQFHGTRASRGTDSGGAAAVELCGCWD
jgi:hypothetical protein